MMSCTKITYFSNTQEALINSEKVRRFKRMAPHIQNDVWKHRSSPPEDWNKPLPAKMQESYKNTYLDYKAAEFKAQQSEQTT